jgi:hypothetical protein
VQDEVRTRNPAQLWWFMHTAAAVECEGNKATLTMNGRRLIARILSPEGATFRVMPAEPLPSSPKLERQQVKGPGSHGDSAGVHKLAIEMDGVSDLTLAVFFTCDEGSKLPPREPLAKW